MAGAAFNYLPHLLRCICRHKTEIKGDGERWRLVIIVFISYPEILKAFHAKIRNFFFRYVEAFVANPYPAFGTFVELDSCFDFYLVIYSTTFLFPKQIYFFLVQNFRDIAELERDVFTAPLKTAEATDKSECETRLVRVINHLDRIQFVRSPPVHHVIEYRQYAILATRKSLWSGKKFKNL
jgi:hypothetical protein